MVYRGRSTLAFAWYKSIRGRMDGMEKKTERSGFSESVHGPTLPGQYLSILHRKKNEALLDLGLSPCHRWLKYATRDACVCTVGEK